MENNMQSMVLVKRAFSRASKIAVVVCAATCPAAVGQVTISYELPETRVSIREPILVDFVLENQSSAPVFADFGVERTAGFTISISHADGRTLASRVSVGLVPPSSYYVVPDFSTRAPAFTVGANRTNRQRLLLNTWYKFD